MVKKAGLAALGVSAVLVLQGCSGSSFESTEDRYEIGYDDGFAPGYNTTCLFRSTLVRGDWDDDHYTEGYNEGYAAGAAVCTRDRG